jgi:WD40 repeat protein
VAFTPDGGHLITGGDDHHLHVWEIGPKPLRTFTLEHASGIRCVAVARHDKHWELLTGTSDGRLRLWRVPNNMVPHDERPQVDVRVHAGAVQAVAFDGAGGRFGSAGQDERIKVWSETGRELAALRGLNGLAFLRDGKTLLAPQADGTVAAWDSSLRSPLGLRDLPRPLTHLTFSPDGKLLAALSDERKVALWEAGSLTPVPVPTAVGEVFAVGFGGDGQCLVARGGPGGGLLLSRATKPDPSVALVGWTGTPVAGAFSPDGRRLALVGPDRAVSVWDTADGHRIWAADTTEAALVRVALSRDGSRLVVLTEREIVARGAAGEVLCAHERPAGSGPPAISPDGLRVATASKDGVVRVWDVDRPDDDGLTLAGRDGSALGLAFTPDGRRVATADKDGAVRIWDTRSEQELVELAARPTEVLALAFAPDGRLAASGKDKSLQVWDGRPLP